MLRTKAILILSTAFLSSCAAPGDFCDVAEEFALPRAIASALSAQDRSEAVKLSAHNGYGRKFCGW